MKHHRLFLFCYLFLIPATHMDAQGFVHPSCSCCKPEFRQFDFWLGNWETYNQGDTLLGVNSIVVLQDSCLIQENWTSARSAYTGVSYNFYNPQTGKWHQTWVDNQGAPILLSGGLENGKMIMYSEKMKNQQGKEYINRITWTPNPDGTVRQYWELSTDEGKTWNGIFDGEYRKKE